MRTRTNCKQIKQRPFIKVVPTALLKPFSGLQSMDNVPSELSIQGQSTRWYNSSARLANSVPANAGAL